MDIPKSLEKVSTDELESSITKLCVDLNAATYRQLVLIAEFDRRKAWGGNGVRSCAHWLNWRCGISLVAAREKVRVAHALEKLPRTSEAFASGQLSYSKARAITRVGTEHNEECLLTYARYGSASHLDKTVRLYRRQFNSAGEMMEDYNQPVFPPKPVDTLANASDDERFDAENQGAMHKHDYRELNCYWDEHGCLIIRARLTAEQGALVMKAMDAAMESINESAPSLESDSHALERNKTPVVESMELNQTVEPLSEKDKLKLKFRNERRKRADSLALLASEFLKQNTPAGGIDDRYQVVIHVDSKVLAKQEFFTPDGKPDCYIEKQVALPVETARRLSCSCKVVTALTREGEPLNISRSSRTIPTGIKRALDIRDGRCMFPGCDCNKHLDAHHIQHWANGGETSLENLVQVCHYHHKLLHEGQYSVERTFDGSLLFKRPDGSVLRNDTGLSTHTPASQKLPEMTDDIWSWCGDSMDYGIAVNGLAYINRHVP
ncbi:MAG: DUF222 domain-containing protein [Granulosicoccus sp.]